ncbi:MAG: N-6 DNA methylase [Pirellulaceae bacterium]
MLRSDFLYRVDASIPLVGFAQIPMDSRSACVAVLASNGDPRSAVETCRALGAPIVFVCFHDTLQWWKQGAVSAEWIESIPSDRVESFFQSHQDDFSPEAVYRAKTLGRVRSEFQLSFVDLGLLPLVEAEVGAALSHLIERNVSGLKNRLGWNDITNEQGHWLLKSVFWLVSGKLLRDKLVPGFEDIELADIEDVFSRVAEHYGTTPFHAGSKQKLAALEESASTINHFSSLALATTESLAYVYENTLISKETRAALGTHSTPPYLVDYIVGNLADWIEEIPENDRNVFEPACGHAAFLVSAMRLLTQLLPPEKAVPSRRGPYLRSRLHGTERDTFAVELARLSLTLTDIPNPDGWDLRVEDMFIGHRLAEQMRGKTILLANPPFEKFSVDELASHPNARTAIVVNNKTAEMLRRTLPELQPGSVFGVVVPQSLLHGTFAQDLRRYLIEHFELREVSLFPDKVFSFSDAESAVLLGRRLPEGSRNRMTLRYRRIRERQMPRFRETYDAPNSRIVEQSRFNETVQWVMRVPDLEEVWLALKDNPKLIDISDVMKGLDYHGEKLPTGVPTYSYERFQGAHQGYIRAERGLEIHQLPKLYWMNLSAPAIRSPRAGATVGIPQILIGYARVSRGPWRLKAFIDRQGRPITSAFIAVRPRTCSLESLWAILNSPLANAYAFCHLGMRHNLVGDMRRIPMPSTFDQIEPAARAYLNAALAESDAKALHTLLLKVDAAVLRQYALPIELERALLSIFTSWNRVGVPFNQNRYFPPELSQPIGLSDFVAYESDWPTANRRRGELVDKEIGGTITGVEAAELGRLQAYADYYLDRVSPRPTHVLEELEDRVFGSTTIRKKGV